MFRSWHLVRLGLRAVISRRPWAVRSWHEHFIDSTGPSSRHCEFPCPSWPRWPFRWRWPGCRAVGEFAGYAAAEPVEEPATDAQPANDPTGAADPAQAAGADAGTGDAAAQDAGAKTPPPMTPTRAMPQWRERCRGRAAKAEHKAQDERQKANAGPVNPERANAEPAVGKEPAMPPAGRLIRVPLPITGSIDSQIKRATERALVELPKNRGPADPRFRALSTQNQFGEGGRPGPGGH